MWMSDTVNGSWDPNTSITLIGPLPTGGSEIGAVNEGGSFEKMRGMVWYGVVWYSKVRYGMVWYSKVGYCTVWYSKLCNRMGCGDTSRSCGMVCYCMAWYGCHLKCYCMPLVVVVW